MAKANPSGGPAAAGGYRFQDAVTAILYTHMLTGTDVGWLSGSQSARPASVLTETGGPGDDVSVVAADGSAVEVQIKKGLRADSRFWSAIESLSEGLHSGKCQWGALVVCPSSSGPVRQAYATAITRVGEGLVEGGSEQQRALVAYLRDRKHDPESICCRLRIETIHAIAGQEADIRVAKSQLRDVCADRDDVAAAWLALQDVAQASTEHSGRRTAARLLEDLEAVSVTVRADVDGIPAGMAKALRDWTSRVAEKFFVLGTRKQLLTDRAWLPLKARVLGDGVEDHESAEEAVRAYRETGAQSGYRRGECIDAKVIGFFRRCCVVVGGPGSGKSLFLKVLAREFSKEALVSVRVHLADVVRGIEAGRWTAEEGLLGAGLAGSGVELGRLLGSGMNDVVMLCDGLDECGAHRPKVAEGLTAIAASRPSWRFVVATRTVGYHYPELSNWRHYELLRPESGRVVENVAKLVESVVGDGRSGDDLKNDVEAYLGHRQIREMVATSPLLLTLAASVFPNRNGLDGSRAGLYDRVFDLIHESGQPRAAQFESVDAVELECVLNRVGWVLADGVLLEYDEVVQRCACFIEEAFDRRPMVAKAETNGAIRYWLATGLLEKVRHGSRDYVVFVHKTFAEYAAARHLADLSSPEEARVLLASVLDAPEFDEVLRFVLETKEAGLFGNLVVERASEGTATPRLLDRACATLVRRDGKVTGTARRELIGDLFELAKTRDGIAYMIGMSIAKAEMVNAPFVRELAVNMVAEDVGAARLVGWTVLARHFAEDLDPVELKRAVYQFLEFALAEPRRRRTVGSTDSTDAMDLYRVFLIAALRTLVPRIDAEAQDELVSRVENAEGLITLGFAEDAALVLRDVGREDLANRLPTLGGAGSWRRLSTMFEAVFDFSELGDGMWSLIDAVVLKAFSGRSQEEGDARGFKSLGAFLELSGFWEMPSNDIAAFDLDNDLALVHQLMCATAYILDLPMDRLAIEAAALLALMTSEEETGERGWRIPAVDAEAANWERSVTAPIDDAGIAALCEHESEWVRSIASTISTARELAA